MKKLLLAMVLIPLIVFLYLILIPNPIDAAVYHPPEPPPLTGVTAPNELLKGADRLAMGVIDGPEDIAVDSQGRIYGGGQDGRIIRILPDGSAEVFADTGGRPLGLHFDAHGHLIVADAWKGLLSIDPQGQITALATQAEGIPFRFTNDLDISADGTIYFSDASSQYSQPEYMLDALEARPHGRLLRYHPATQEVEVLIRDLYFANGVALSAAEDFVLVNETWRYRIVRYWLKGPREGTHEIFIDNLPGFPDGVSGNRQGVFWVALPSPRNPFLDRIHPHPWIKNMVAKLPAGLRPKPVDYGFVLALDEQGRITRSLHDTDGTVLREITSVQQHGGDLYCGTLHNRWVGRLALP